MTMLPPDPIYIFKGEMVSVSCVAFRVTELSQSVFAGTQSGKVHVWDFKSKREKSSFRAGNDSCLSICIAEEEDVVITHVKSGDICFWMEDDINKIETLERLDLAYEKSGDIMALKVFAMKCKTFMIVAYEGLKLGLWDVKESKEVSKLQLAECPMAVDYDVNTNKGLCGDPSDKILIFSFEVSFNFKVEKYVPLTNAGVAAVTIRPDAKVVAVGCWDGKLRLYSWKSLVLLAVLDSHSETVQDVSFCSSYKEGGRMKYLLAAGSQDSRISLWDLYN